MKANGLRALSDALDSTDPLNKSATLTRAFWPMWVWAVLVAISCGLCGCKTLDGKLGILGSSWDGSIGATLSRNNNTGRVSFQSVPRSMSGYLAGLRSGDELIAIEDKPVKGMNGAEISKALRGRVGTKVHLVIIRETDQLNITVERGPFRN